MANSEDKRPQFGNRFLVDKGDVFKHNSWDDVEWDEEQLEVSYLYAILENGRQSFTHFADFQKAKEQVAKNSRVTMSAEDRERIESEAGKKWDEFYGVHSNKFFKNRNWLFTEFPGKYIFSGIC
jgi:nucleoside-specific outer membrane channel protein Tsx